MTPQAISADWPKGLPFSPQQLAIIKQTKLALETYQVDGDKKGVIDDTKMYYGAMKGLVVRSGIPLPVCRTQGARGREPRDGGRIRWARYLYYFA